MKITITMKNPDSVSDAINDCIDSELERLKLTEYDLDGFRCDLKDQIEDEIKPWVKYGEYITIEIDTETKEAKVVKNF